ncbi:MAG: PAS domain S-box protein [Melioribacteraceae bacterium]|nr:PAS domain S-box protein [Melioribacteraceae bacterium]
MMRDRYRVTDQQTKETDNKGEIRYFVNNAFGIIEDNHLIRIWGTQRDITKLVEAEEEKKILQKAVEQSQVSIVITDLSEKIQYVNPKFEAVTGYTFEEAIGKNPNILKSGLTDTNEYKELWEKISKGENWSGVFHNRKKNGDLFFESATISPITDESGKVKHYVAVKEDITNEREMIAELKKAKEKAELSDKLKTEFLAQMSHEIRSPLNAIISFTGLIEDEISENIDEDLEVAFDAIHSASKRIIRTIDFDIKYVRTPLRHL